MSKKMTGLDARHFFIIHHIQGFQAVPQGFPAANTVSQPA